MTSGTWTEDGFLYLTDRKHFMIISGGVNIYPQEAENTLITHEDVVDVAVFGVPNADFGEEVKAVVQPRDMARAGPELELELMGLLPRAVIPREVPAQHLIFVRSCRATPRANCTSGC